MVGKLQSPKLRRLQGELRSSTALLREELEIERNTFCASTMGACESRAAADVARNLCADRRASALDAEELQQETARMCTARLREIDRPPALDEVAAALVDAQREFRDVRASVARSKAECALEEEALSDEIALERSRQAEIRTAASEMQAAYHNIQSTIKVLTHESQELDLEESDERTRAELRNIEEEHAAGEASFEARLHLTFEQWEGVRSRACSVEVDSGFEGVNLKHGRNVLGPLPQSSVPCVHQADIAKVHPLTTRRRSVSEGVGDVTANQIGIGLGSSAECDISESNYFPSDRSDTSVLPISSVTSPSVTSKPWRFPFKWQKSLMSK